MSGRSVLVGGVLEGCVLAIVRKQPVYGYEILRTLHEAGFSHVAEGTVYTILLRLEHRGLAVKTIELSPSGPARKVYSLTQEGDAAEQRFWHDWRELAASVETVADLAGDGRKE